MLFPILAVFVSYLIGAIPTGFIIAKQLKGIDIRDHGSGNVGATNVKRVVGPKAGLATLILDFFKGLVPVFVVSQLFSANEDPHHVIPVLCGLAAIIGHSKSIYIGFKGGKSVITSLGVLLMLEPLPALITAVAAISVMKLTRYVSLGSIIGACLIAPLVWVFHGPLIHVWVTLGMGLYVIYLHRTNIQRLVTHQENRL